MTIGNLGNKYSSRLLTAVLFSLSALWLSCTQADVADANMDADVAGILKAVSKRLADSEALQFEATILFNTLEQDNKDMFEVRIQYFVQRPNKLRVRGRRDDGSRFSAWYDGQTFSTLESDLNTYSEVNVPGSIDDLLDSLIGDVELPLADLLYSDPFASFTRQLVKGVNRGRRTVSGELCDYLSLETEESHFQIWVTAGGDPTPRRFVVNHFEVPGAPQLIAELTNWNFAPKLDDAMFQFTPPPGATREP